MTARPLRQLAVLAGCALLSVTAWPAASGTAAAATATATARPTDRACPALQVQSAGFVDMARSSFAREIGCLAAYRIAAGTSTTTYTPAASVNRAQMAVFLWRLGTGAGVQWDTSDAGFSDIGGLPAQEQGAINALANAGVTQGRTPTRYAPGDVVTRDQMASFLNRFQAAATGSGFQTSNDYFTDDANDVHQADINAIASVGITAGTRAGANRYLPAEPVSREQMAGFLARLLDIEVAAGKVASVYDHRACLPVSSWSADRLAAAVIIAPVQLGSLDSAGSMVSAGIGGILLYGSTPSPQLAAQLFRLRAAEPDGWPLVVASDEEGGAVQRLADLTGGLPSARQMSTEGTAAVRRHALTLGSTLKALGVTVDLAPVAGLDAGPGPSSTHPLGTRSFSADPQTASDDVVAFTAGLQQAGMLPSVKHFPGLGTASGNTDNGAATTAPWSQLQQRDVLPFRAAIQAGARGMMTSNAIVPDLTSQPVSLSGAATTSVLRQQYGYRGVIFTDSLSANAISQAGYTVPQAAVQALVAGADAILFGTGASRDAGPQAQQIRSAIVAAVQGGKIPLARLRTAAAAVAEGVGRTTC